MMAAHTQTTKRKRTLQQVTSYLSPRLGIKDRMRAIREADHRQTESRIIEDALLYYMPILEQRVQPMQDAPAPRRRQTVGA